MSDTTISTSNPTTTLLPILRLPSVVLPGTVVTISLDHNDARVAVEAAGRGDGRLVLLADDGDIGVVARVPNTATLPSGEQAAIVQAERRARLVTVHASERGTDHADVELIADTRPTPRVEAATRELRVVLEEIAKLRQSRRLPEILRTVNEAGALADAVTTWSEADDERRAQVLHTLDIEQRVALLTEWARRHIAELQVSAQIRADVTEGVDKQQRDYLLRQQMTAIRKELGEGDDDVVGEYRTKLDELRHQLPEKTASFVAKEIDRLDPVDSRSSRRGTGFP